MENKNNVENKIKKLLGSQTFVSQTSGKQIQAQNIADILNGKPKRTIKPTSENKKNVRRVDKLTEELVKTCNKILIKRDNECKCDEDDNNCSNNNKLTKCSAYNKCRKIFNHSLNGSEPEYNPDSWDDPLVEGTHNCYMYFLNDQKDSLKKKCYKLCKENGNGSRKCKTKKHSECSNLKPQPGNHAYLQGNFKGNRRVYSCPAMVDKVLKDNYKKGTKKSKIIHWDNLTHHQQFIKKCPDKHYKGVLVVHPENTYHFYRQDKNGRYSHKQGTLRVEDLDASKNPIYVPHLANMNYSKGKKSGINYTDFCGYMCVPSNKQADTQAH